MQVDQEVVGNEEQDSEVLPNVSIKVGSVIPGGMVIIRDEYGEYHILGTFVRGDKLFIPLR